MPRYSAPSRNPTLPASAFRLWPTSNRHPRESTVIPAKVVTQPALGDSGQPRILPPSPATPCQSRMNKRAPPLTTPTCHSCRNLVTLPMSTKVLSSVGPVGIMILQPARRRFLSSRETSHAGKSFGIGPREPACPPLLSPAPTAPMAGFVPKWPENRKSRASHALSDGPIQAR